MVEIEYTPWKIIIHEIRELDNAALFEAVASQYLVQGSSNPSVYWFDGIAMMILDFPPSAQLEDERVRGRLHYLSVSFSSMPSFTTQREVMINSHMAVIKFVKITNPTLQEVVTWIKSHNPNITSEKS
jgi:hypothetical protein